MKTVTTKMFGLALVIVMAISFFSYTTIMEENDKTAPMQQPSIESKENSRSAAMKQPLKASFALAKTYPNCCKGSNSYKCCGTDDTSELNLACSMIIPYNKTTCDSGDVGRSCDWVKCNSTPPAS